MRAPFNNVEAIETIAGNHDNVVAILVEPILGEGGVVVPAPGYLSALRRICDEQNWLLMLDEIQTGNGRTGEFLAYQHTDIVPDVITLAKGLANGVPIGACLARGEAANVLVPGTHGSTFGGNPLSCAAGNATLDVMEKENLVQRAAEAGDKIMERLRSGLHGLNHVVEIRGKGLMIGVELDHPCAELVQKAMQDGYLINVAQERVVRILPPLTLSDEQVSDLGDYLVELITGAAGPTS